jgi:superfamily II DNA or RNA helicase
VDLVIVDEAHQLHREVFRWMKDCPTLPFIGLSATPWSRGLGKFYVFCVNRRHAQHVAERFAEAGVAVEYMDGMTPREEREATFARLRSRETTIICNVGVLTTGVDLDVRCIIDAKPTKSRILFVQIIGRGLRAAPGKDKLLILDHAGNHLRLGMVTDIGQDRLDDGSERQASNARKRKRSQPLPKLCEECKAVLAGGARACPSCGADIQARTDIEAVAGDLVEFGARRGGKREPAAWEKARFYAELLGYAERKGFKSGWAFHKFIERFKHQPAGYPHVAMEPSVATLNWIKSRQIAWAKAKAKARMAA